MFLSLKYSGINRHGEQSAAGQFLILMQPHPNSRKYPRISPYCAECGLVREAHDRPTVPPCPRHGIVARLKATARKQTGIAGVLVDEILAKEIYRSGCAACAAQKEYATHCNYFRPHPITYPLRGIVRYVRMHQLGHFMMATARIGKTSLSLSGAYGSDGLPVNAPDEAYEAGTPLPQELYDAWNHGGGWNATGSERDAMQAWAKRTLISGRKQ